ncbi:metal-independent alpha-mannosidase [Nitzschia inconspicua]|uniref:Metal-independent alpha-mannosidase n=1 Tax=Nitzschia inconspicua TaxID=303405 RepID=A0A9K3PYW1_9STRA|nr:metal-independent alpha-mannosidase [Nitzschia inconspicua]
MRDSNKVSRSPGSNQRSVMPRRQSHVSKGGTAQSRVSHIGLLGLPIFIILSLFNLGIALLRLEKHQYTNRALEVTSTLDSSARQSNVVLDSPSRPLLPPSIWSTRKLQEPVDISPFLSANETERAKNLCGKFIYSTLQRAVQAGDMAEEVFVETGDIEFMWIRDSVVQMSTYLNHHMDKPWLRFIVEGAIRRNAFNILQDPYANAFYHEWKNPDELSLKDRVIGRGGFVATRNYELDSGAYFLSHLYDYYMAKDIYRPEALLAEPMIFEAVLLMVETWIVEQNHEEKSPYRYFELSREGLGTETGYTGMTWTGFRPSDDACKFGYLVPANIHAAAALERVLILNNNIWKHQELETKASRLLSDIEEGINNFGVVTDQNGNQIYAYEVDGLGGVLSGFDDANIPSLLSIPLLGWSGYDHQIYLATRNKILSHENTHYFEGSQLKGIGSPHTPKNNVWPMALVIQGLTEEGNDRAEKMAFQMKQLLLTACKDAMHESNKVDSACLFTRTWFEWANALFVLYAEATLGVQCDAIGNSLAWETAVAHANDPPNGNENKNVRLFGKFYSNPYHNNPELSHHYQGVAASVKFDTTPSTIDVEKKIKNEVIAAFFARERKQNAPKIQDLKVSPASNSLRHGTERNAEG